MKQERQQKTSREHRREETAPSKPAKTVDADALKSELDDLLDEIDEILEENAEEFVSQYVQKGGE